MVVVDNKSGENKAAEEVTKIPIKPEKTYLLTPLQVPRGSILRSLTKEIVQFFYSVKKFCS